MPRPAFFSSLTLGRPRRSGAHAQLFAGCGYTYSDYIILPGMINFAAGDVNLRTLATKRIALNAPSSTDASSSTPCAAPSDVRGRCFGHHGSYDSLSSTRRQNGAFRLRPLWWSAASRQQR